MGQGTFTAFATLVAEELEVDPQRIEVRRYRDREGQTAFVTVRILAPHDVTYAGRFQIALREPD